MRLCSALLFVVALAAFPVEAVADPQGDIAQMAEAWSAVKSVHVDEKLSDGKTIGIDMIMPDKFHETLFNKMQVVIIGPDMWMNTGSKWMKMPMVMPQMKTWIEWAKKNGLTSGPKDYTITDLGPSTIGTTPAEHYRMVNKTKNTTVETWIGKDHLPIQTYVPNGKESITIAYSKYNLIPDITAPI